MERSHFNGLYGEEELQERIRHLAECYVPEWKFDRDNPDIGTALALIYARMFAGTLQRFALVPEKNRIAFLGELGAELLPAVPAGGYVTFSLVNSEAGGVEAEAGISVSAWSKEAEGGMISYRTLDEVYVTPAGLREIYQTDKTSDSIFLLYDREREAVEKSLPLFCAAPPGAAGTSLQRHELYLGHPEVFHMRKNGTVTLRFTLPGSRGISEEMIKRLLDPDLVSIEYLSASGYVPFRERTAKGDHICLIKAEDQPEAVTAEEMEAERGSCAVRLRAFNVSAFRDFAFEQVELCSSGRVVQPELLYLYADGAERAGEPFFPFGERLSMFGEVYFGCTEALEKKGASIELSFRLTFARLPFNDAGDQGEIQWDWIMKKSDFKPDPEYDITVGAVLWEYYNGVGWARLFPDRRYETVFYPEKEFSQGRQSIRFICPADMASVTVGSRESAFVRARIVRINNLFKQKGTYISPVLEQISFGYSYEDNPVYPSQMRFYNNLEWEMAAGREEGIHPIHHPFLEIGKSGRVLYLGFDRPFGGSPIRLYAPVLNSAARREAGLIFELYDGARWREADVMDETENFSRPGLVTIDGNTDSAMLRLFGKRRAWLRITDSGNVYQASEKRKKGSFLSPPVLSGLWLNTVRVLQTDKRAVQNYRMDTYREKQEIRLPDRRLLEADVWINEASGIQRKELEQLRSDSRVICVPGESGGEEIWVRWICVRDFMDSGPEDRHFLLDRNEGILRFGDGRRGKMPPLSDVDNIRVEYLQGGGSLGNVKAGESFRLDQELGFINRVENPEALTGGSDREPFQEAVMRSTAAIRHQGRAVTARDFEDLVRSASRSIRRVRCFAGLDIAGGDLPGAVTLVVVRDPGSRSETQFETVRDQVRAALLNRVSSELWERDCLFIREPEFAELQIRAEVGVSGDGGVFRMKKMIQDRLRDFLDPLTGNFHQKGWEIGTLPDRAQIQNAIAGVPGVFTVKNLYLKAYTCRGGERREEDLERLAVSPYVLPLSGRHEVFVTPVRRQRR